MVGTWRKAYGAIKDSTTVGLAKVNSEFKDLDVSIVKATNHVECPPKERHVRKIFAATSVSRPRADVAYCIYALSRRLSKTKNWTVALKTLIVIHRLLREGDPTFKEELLNYSHRGQVLQLSNFLDDSSPLAWDCSAWVRTYALFIEERLECFRVLKYDVEAERLVKSAHGDGKVSNRTRTLGCPELLDQLPALQKLQHHLVGCQPEGGAFGNYLIQYALALVLKESFKLYCAINDGIINLVEMFFEMSRFDAIKALEIYKRAAQQAENLSDFYEFCKSLDLARTFQFPTLRHPPPTFLATMEEYIKEAPQYGSVSSKKLEYEEKNTQADFDKEANPQSPKTVAGDQEEQHHPPLEAEVKKHEEVLETPVLGQNEPGNLLEGTTGDLLGLNEIHPMAAEIEESNALALAIIQPGDDMRSIRNNAGQTMSGSGTESTGWELALVTAPSNNTNHVVESKLGGGFDKLLLDSLYEDAGRRQQMAAVASAAQNSWEPQDPFVMSSGFAPPPSVQMALMTATQHQQQLQQQHYYYNNQIYQQQLQQQQNQLMIMSNGSAQVINYQLPTPQNPFGDPFAGFPIVPHHPQGAGGQFTTLL